MIASDSKTREDAGPSLVGADLAGMETLSETNHQCDMYLRMRGDPTSGRRINLFPPTHMRGLLRWDRPSRAVASLPSLLAETAAIRRHRSSITVSRPEGSGTKNELSHRGVTVLRRELPGTGPPADLWL